MKTIRIKILFTIFLFSAIVPFTIQAMEAVKLMGRNDKNFYNSSQACQNVVVTVVVGGAFGILGIKFYEETKKRWDYHQSKKKAEKIADDRRKELLDKIGTGELVEGSCGRPYRLTFLNPEKVKKVRKSLALLKIPKSVAEKILIFGIEYEDYFKSGKISRATALGIYINETHVVPYAIMIDTKFLKEASSLVQEHYFDHEVGHVKAWCEGDEVVGDKEQNELVAEVYAIISFINRRKKKNHLFDLVSDPYMITKPSMVTEPKGPYLSPQEWICHEAKLSDIQQRGQKLDVPTYVQKIAFDRKKGGYKEQVEQRATKLGFTATKPHKIFNSIF